MNSPLHPQISGTRRGIILQLHCLSYRGKFDPAGNVSAVVLYTWNVDTAAPNTNITANPGTVTTSTSATFTANQTGSTFECNVDGAGFTGCTSPATYNGLALGRHNFQVRATDPAGNTDQTPASFDWTIQ